MRIFVVEIKYDYIWWCCWYIYIYIYIDILFLFLLQHVNFSLHKKWGPVPTLFPSVQMTSQGGVEWEQILICFQRVLEKEKEKLEIKCWSVSLVIVLNEYDKQFEIQLNVVFLGKISCFFHTFKTYYNTPVIVWVDNYHCANQLYELITNLLMYIYLMVIVHRRCF